MTKQQLTETLQTMVGKQFKYKDQTHKLLNFTIDNLKVMIATDLTILSLTAQEASAQVRLFKPVAQEVSKALSTIPQNEQMGQLKDVIMNSIERLKGEPDFIPQAQAINEQVKTVIEMGKLELDAFRALGKNS